MFWIPSPAGRSLPGSALHSQERWLRTATRVTFISTQSARVLTIFFSDRWVVCMHLKQLDRSLGKTKDGISDLLMGLSTPMPRSPPVRSRWPPQERGRPRHQRRESEPCLRSSCGQAGSRPLAGSTPIVTPFADQPQTMPSASAWFAPRMQPMSSAPTCATKSYLVPSNARLQLSWTGAPCSQPSSRRSANSSGVMRLRIKPRSIRATSSGIASVSPT